jgi:zinc/manganese transport system permease protein
MSWLGPTFLQHALLAGTAIAIACGLVGWFLVVRGQVFAGDALSHVTFTGALAALAVGFSARWGLFVAAVVVAIGLGLLARVGGRRVVDDVLIGNLFAWVLGAGVLLLSVYSSGGHGDDAGAGVRVLFGSVLGLSSGDVVIAIAVSGGVVLAMLALLRPLLFATMTPSVAQARGLPVAAIGIAFLALTGLASAEAVQVTGALPLLGLLAGPAATAQLITDRPYRSLALSVGLSVLAVWLGLAISYWVDRVPPSTGVVAGAVGSYLVVLAVRSVAGRAGATSGARLETG